MRASHSINAIAEYGVKRVGELFGLLMEILPNFAAWLKACAWIEEKEGGTSVRFKLWPAQEGVLPILLNKSLVIILKARQLGLTWLVAAYVLWVAIRKPLQLIIVISSKEQTAQEFLERVKFMLRRLPMWARPEVSRETTQELEISHTDPEGNAVNSVIKSLPTTEHGAQSKTPNILVIDEAHAIREIATMYAASKPGIDAAKGQIIVIANSIKTAPGWPFVRKLYVDSMQGLNDFSRIFLPWSAHPERPVDFRARQLREGMDEEDVSLHYPETEAEAISILGGSYFGKVLQRHNETMPGLKGRLEWDKDGTLQFVEDRHGIWEFWKFPYHLHPDWKDGHDPHWLDRYCAGTDVAEGLGADFSVLYVMDRVSHDLVARCRSNRLDGDEWGHEVFKGVSFYKDPEQGALLCPARRGAVTSIKRLEKLGFRNFYIRQVADVIGNGMTTEIGFMETEESKKELAGDLKTYFRTTKATVYDATLIEECSHYTRKDNGKLEAEEGFHDDCVVAAACAVQANIWLDRLSKPIPRDDRPQWLIRDDRRKQSAWTV